MPDAVQLAQSLVSGVGVGLIYGLGCIAFCVIYIKARPDAIATCLGTETAHA